MTRSEPRSSSIGGGLPAYRMPAEWEPHQGTWLAWPHNADTWPHALDRVEQFYVQVVRTLLTGEEVHILVNDAATERRALALLDLATPPERLRFHHVPTDDAWCRDYGATFLQSLDPHGAMPARLAIDWGFNAWGGKYPPWENDNRVAGRMARAIGVQALSGSMVLEGGAIEVNGQGVLMTTDTCLLNPNRNPLLSRSAIEAKLSKLLGVSAFIWLSGELAGDDTDGHIDQLARFVRPDCILTISPGAVGSRNHAALSKQKKQLEQAAAQHLFEVAELPPPPSIEKRGDPLPASYANFYIANRVVLVPQFRAASDDAACQMIASHFPERRVVGIDCFDVVDGLGAIHCLTQQIPIALR